MWYTQSFSGFMFPFILAQQTSSQGIGLFLPFILVIGIFYFLIIRPTRQRQKSLEDLINGLKNGDKVITNGGLFGTIAKVKDSTFVLKVADQVKVEISKNAIASLQSNQES